MEARGLIGSAQAAAATSLQRSEEVATGRTAVREATTSRTARRTRSGTARTARSTAPAARSCHRPRTRSAGRDLNPPRSAQRQRVLACHARLDAPVPGGALDADTAQARATHLRPPAPGGCEDFEAAARLPRPRP